MGSVDRAAIDSRSAVLRASGLRPIAADHESLAFSRAFPDFDAVMDIGARRSSAHALDARGTYAVQTACAGDAISAAIARDLAIDAGTAEKRKRILGCAGASGAADTIVAELAGLLERVRARRQVERVALTGNGARLPTLAAELARVGGVRVEVAASPWLAGDAYPQDVLRMSAPDWSLAAGLAGWQRA